MNRSICAAAFVVGLAAVIWVGAGYIGANPLALAMTALIGAVYLTGAFELFRFQRATTALNRALAAVPDDLPSLGDWLVRLPPSLRNPVRLRIEGERAALPGPALTPYLVGLLVLLGMLGTFLGMAVTLNGAVSALESGSDLQAIRSALAAPVKGLGVAFGTSIAGVSASAMLGLISALCRRARLESAQLLDTCIATSLRGFSLVQQRQEAFAALRTQAEALPALVDKLQAMMAQMERHSRELHERLAGEQERFYRDARDTYASLADSVGASLQASLSESARVAGETLRPIAAATMDSIARETAALQARVAEAVDRQLAGIAARFDASVTAVTDTWRAAQERQERDSERLAARLDQSLHGFAETFVQRSEALLAVVREQLAAVQRELAAQEQARQAALTETLARAVTLLQEEWREASVRAQAQQERAAKVLVDTARDIAATTQAQANAALAEVARLMETAAEAPRAAAEVIGELRRELSASIARDNALLAERQRVLETLNTLLSTIDQAAGAQREAIEGLVASAASMLERAGDRFERSVDAETARLQDAAAQVGAGAVEVAAVSEAFERAVQLFADSNEQLTTALARIEGALEKSMARSDEQLAYYVAQAREIIDLAIMAQQRILEELRHAGAAVTGEA